ncbi:MAG: RNA ligase family protein [Flavobacteriaceae bacterium]|nr:RNA ligase family protein [Flavobacteriaceae bacterium]
MNLKKYNSIENSYQEKVLDRIRFLGLNKEKFIVQEKVHGANFSFQTNGNEIKIAKRTDFILPDEVFFNGQQILEKYRSNVFQLFEDLKNLIPSVAKIAVFGEIFGGAYKHPDVKRINDAIKVQKGIDYAPFNEFYAFDIMIDDTEFLDVETANQYFEKHGFFYARTLFEGDLEEALKFPKEFNSKIPEWLNLPEIEDNECEGVIIKPLKPAFFGNGARIILKNKNEKWSEKVKVERKEIEATPLSESAEKVLTEILSFINLNRLNNLMSKIGRFEPKLIGKINGLLVQDALEDFKNEFSADYESLEKEEQKKVNKRVNSFSLNLIKNEFLIKK